MPELTLSLEEDFWKVGDKLIDKLDQLVTPPENEDDLEAMISHRFPEENVLQDQIDVVKTKIDGELARKLGYDDEAKSLANLKTLFTQVAEKQNLEDQKVTQTQDIQAINQEIDTINQQLITDSENQELKDRKQLLDQHLINANKKLTQTNTALEPLGDLDTKIEAEKQNLDNVRQLQVEDTTALEEVTSLAIATTQEATAIANQQTVRIALENYETNKNTLETRLRQVTERYDTQRGLMREKLQTLKEIKGISRAESGNVNFEHLQKSLNEMATVTPDIYQEIIRGVAQNATAAEFDKKRQDLKADMTEKFKNAFNDGGSSHQVQVEVEVGAGISGLVAKAQGTLVASLALTVTKDDNGKLSVKKTLQGGIRVKGQAGLALSNANEAALKGQISAMLTDEKSKTYDNLDNFIAGEAANVSSAFLDYSLSKNVFPSGQYKALKVQQKSIVQQEAAIVGKADLEQKLRRIRLITEDQNLKVPDRPEISYVQTNSVGASADAQASAAVKFADGMGIGIGASTQAAIKYSRNYKQKTIHLIDDVAAHPTLGNIYGRKYHQNFGFMLKEGLRDVSFSGEAAIDKLDAIEAQIDAYQENVNLAERELRLTTLRAQLKGALENLSLEYQMFVQAENNAEREKSSPEELLRNNLRGARRTANSAEYLRAVSLQYANLRRAYDKSFLDSESFNQDDQAFINDFERDLKEPKFKLPNNSDNILNINQNTPTSSVYTEETAATIEAKAFNADLNNLNATAPGVQLSTKYTETTAPDGEVSKEYSLKFNLTSGAKGDNFVATLLNHADFNRMEEKGASRQAVSDSITAALQSMATGNLEIKIHQKKQGWEVKYVRGYEASAKKVGGKVTFATVGNVGAVAGVTGSIAHVNTIYEKPGDNSLSYITDLYRAKKIRTKGPDDWESYDKKHELLNKMMLKLKTGSNNISEELENWFIELKNSGISEGEAVIQDVKDKLDQYRTQGDAKKAEFKDAFVALIAKKTAQEDTKIKQQFQTRRTALTKDMQQYAAEVIGSRMQKIVDNHSLTAEQGGSIENMLTWAKGVYNYALKAKQDLDDLAKAARDEADKAWKEATTAKSDNESGDDSDSDVPDATTQAEVKEEEAEKAQEKAEAATEELQKRFQTLKSVFGIQYTANTMEDQISSKEPGAQNEALRLLDTGLEAMIYEQSKVYLNKGLTGELTLNADGKLKIKPIVVKGNKDILADTTIAHRVEAQMGGVEYTSLPTVEVNDSNQEITRKQVTLSPIRQLSSRLSDRMVRSRSVRSAVNLLGDNRKTISDYIAQVMQKSLAQRRQAQAQKSKISK